MTGHFGKVPSPVNSGARSPVSRPRAVPRDLAARRL